MQKSTETEINRIGAEHGETSNVQPWHVRIIIDGIIMCFACVKISELFHEMHCDRQPITFWNNFVVVNSCISASIQLFCSNSPCMPAASTKITMVNND